MAESANFNATNHSLAFEAAEQTTSSIGLNNALYYVFLIPIGLICNALTLSIVVVIMRNRRSTRQSVPDGCICLLTALDLFSLIFIHLPTIVSLAIGEKTVFSGRLCVYQAALTSFYLKFQFLTQVIMALDRFFAVTFPLSYHRLSAFRTFKTIIAALVTLSAAFTVLLFVFETGSTKLLSDWRFCVFQWRLHYTVDYVINLGISVVFAVGFLVFLFSNVAIVRFMCRYDSQKAEILTRDISNAMKAMENKDKESESMLPTKPNEDETVPNDWTDSMNQNNETNSLLPIKQYDETNSTLIDENTAMEDLHSKESTAKENDLIRQSVFITEESDDRITAATGPLVHHHHSIKSMGENPLEMFVDHRYVKQEVGDNKGASIGATRRESKTEEEENKHTAAQSGHIQHKSRAKGPDGEPAPGEPEEEEEGEEEDGENCEYVRIFSARLESNSTTSDQPQGGSSARQRFANRQPLYSASVDDQKDDLGVDSGSEFCPRKSSRLVRRLRKCLSLSQVFQSRQPLSESDSRMSFVDRSQKRRLNNNLSLPPPLPPMDSDSTGIGGEADPSSSNSNSNAMLYAMERIRSLLERSKRCNRRRSRHLLLLKCVLLCGFIFALSWIPYIAFQLILLFGGIEEVSDVMIEASVKLIFANAVFNALLHCLFRRNYRKGVCYIWRTAANALLCGFVKKPSDDLVFFESKRKMRDQHQKAAEMNRKMKVLQQIQKTLHQTRTSRASHNWTAGDLPGARGDAGGGAGGGPGQAPDFLPSKRLQELFDQCTQEDSIDSDESETSDIDYDALVFAEQVKIYEEIYELKTVIWQVRV